LLLSYSQQRFFFAASNKSIVLFLQRSLLAGVDASAAQKQPVTKTCLQCGAILPSGVSACRFCDSNYQAKLASPERASVLSRCDLERSSSMDESCPEREAILLSSDGLPPREATPDPSAAWRGELSNRLQAYRVKRQRASVDVAQSKLPFAESIRTEANVSVAPVAYAANATSVAVAEPPAAEDDFSFTIAIGRIAKERPPDGRMMIDVSIPTDGENLPEGTVELTERAHAGLYPVASIRDRQIAGIIDTACLLFACGGFLALFGSLGGQLTLSKLNAAVCMTALAVVYFQYFALFTIFGGTTPGMMFRGLQVVSFSGDEPTPRQMLQRSAGYMLSAGTCFMGFLWAMWDEDGLTWHDRFSKTYLSSAETYAEIESHTAAHPQ
jgi:uncharacterized RDD family membrane protein YckC